MRRYRDELLAELASSKIETGNTVLRYSQSALEFCAQGRALAASSQERLAVSRNLLTQLRIKAPLDWALEAR